MFRSRGTPTTAEVADATRAAASSRLDCCWDSLVPATPQLHIDYATFLVYPSCFLALGRVAVILDTRALGGSVFAAVVSPSTNLQELRRAAGCDTVRPNESLRSGA